MALDLRIDSSHNNIVESPIDDDDEIQQQSESDYATTLSLVMRLDTSES